MQKTTYVLLVLDGWGIGAQNESNPIHIANPGNFAWLADNFPLTSLQASGIAVGLPWNEVGNSEVGHLTLGAGKVIYQYFPKITMAIDDGSFYENPVLTRAFDHAKEHNSTVHFAGLLTKASVHAAISHLEALIRMAEKRGAERVKLHLFADGKDSPPHTIPDIIRHVPEPMVATIIGRHYAMNRSEAWDLTQKAYDCMVGPGGEKKNSVSDVLQVVAKSDLSEEFLPPYRIGDFSGIADNDALVFFNFREDSILQLAEAFAKPGFDRFPAKQFSNLYVATFTQYSESLVSPVAFPADAVEKPLGQVISDAGLSQLRIAETYKHAHVTYFFNGHREPPFPGEYRVMLPSLPGPHPDEHPELMASAITDRIIDAIQNKEFDFILANYSNPDTIAHTGNYDACIEAVKIVDQEIGRILKTALTTDTKIIITSDHGNMEEVISPVTGQIETQHDVNPVPFYLIGPEFKGRKFMGSGDLRTRTMGILSDVAPTLLEIMNIPVPPEMSGRSLLQDLM